MAVSPLNKQTHLGRLVAFYRSMGFELTGRAINPLLHPEMLRPSLPDRHLRIASAEQANHMFHGTHVALRSRELRPSTGGELGAGLYVTRDPAIAMGYTQQRDEVPNLWEAQQQAGVLVLDTQRIHLKAMSKKEFLADRNHLYDVEMALNHGEWDAQVAQRAERKQMQGYISEGFGGLYVQEEGQGVVFPEALTYVRRVDAWSLVGLARARQSEYVPDALSCSA